MIAGPCLNDSANSIFRDRHRRPVCVPPGRRRAFQNGRLGVTALCLQDQRKGTMERRGFGHTHREIAGIGQGARYTREQRSGNRGCGLAAFRRKSKRECSGEKSGAMNQLECVPMQTWISRFMLSAFVYSLLQGQANPVLKPVAHAPSILVQPQFLGKLHRGGIGCCNLCGEPYPIDDGAICRACAGETPYVVFGEANRSTVAWSRQ